MSNTDAHYFIHFNRKSIKINQSNRIKGFREGTSEQSKCSFDRFQLRKIVWVYLEQVQVWKIVEKRDKYDHPYKKYYAIGAV